MTVAVGLMHRGVVETERGAHPADVRLPEVVLVAEPVRQLGPGHRVRRHEVRPLGRELVQLLDGRWRQVPARGQGREEGPLLLLEDPRGQHRRRGVAGLEGEVRGAALDDVERTAHPPARQAPEQLGPAEEIPSSRSGVRRISASRRT